VETGAVPASGDVRAEQFAVEQSAVAAMYARLDERRSETREALLRAVAAVPVDAAGCFERELEVSRLRRLAADFDAAEAGLCFGRLDAADGCVLYVGRVGLRSDDGTPLVVDWRARAARPFYAATAADSMQVRRRRHLRVVDRRVVEVSDEILDGSEPSKADLVGDGPLVHALSRARTGQMRSAVSTLQREQDAIIRSTFPGIVVVDGGPGTGKTVVALHRAAYLLYTEPRLADLGALVVGPNRVFLDYIERVLPSLGQGKVALAALDEFVAIDSTATRDIDDARVKGTEMMAGALARYLASRRRLPAAATLGAGVDRVQDPADWQHPQSTCRRRSVG
jgi:DNA helicase IV